MTPAIESMRIASRSTSVATIVALRLGRGEALASIDRDLPGVLAAMEADARIDWRRLPKYTAEERAAFFGASSGAQGATAHADVVSVDAAPAAPVIPTAPERVDWRALSDAERDALVLAAPADGLRGWLSSRGIAPPDFYRHRASLAQRDAA